MDIVNASKTYPKVLLLCSMNQNSANGITIANLFKNWPSNRIALTEVNGCYENSHVSNIKHYYIFGESEMRFLWPFNYLRKSKKSMIVSHDNPVSLQVNPSLRADVGVNIRNKPQKRERKRKCFFRGLTNIFIRGKRSFLEKTGFILITRRYRISLQYESWFQEFAPDIVYCVASDLCKLNFFASLLDYFKVKGCIHVFDDYLTTRHEGTLFPGYWRKRLDVAFRQVCSLCELHLAISDKMATEYKQRYGKTFYAFHNPIDPYVWLAQANRALNIKELKVSTQAENQSNVINRSYSREKEPDTFTFLYAGKINKDTVEPIRMFIRAIKRLQKNGYKLGFGIHSPYPFEEIERLLGSSAKEVYLGKISYSELPEAYRKADGLLLPIDFTEMTIRYIRLSMLTKASEYMISGTPIFCFAPANIAVSEYLVDCDAAIHCHHPQILEKAIMDFIHDSEARKRVAGNAVKRALNYHMISQVNERLRFLLENAI